MAQLRTLPPSGAAPSAPTSSTSSAPHISFGGGSSLQDIFLELVGVVAITLIAGISPQWGDAMLALAAVLWLLYIINVYG